MRARAAPEDRREHLSLPGQAGACFFTDRIACVTGSTDRIVCATVSAGRRLEVAPGGARRAGSGLVTGRDLEESSGLAGSTGSSVLPGSPGLAGFAELPYVERGSTLQAESLRHMGGPGCQRVSPLTTGLLACCPRTDRTTRRAVPSPVLHAGSITVPTPLLRNRFLSLVRFPSRHAAVRSADEPVSPSFGPLAGLTPERHEARTSGSQVLPGLPGSSG